MNPEKQLMELEQYFITEYGSSKMDLVKDYLEGTVSWMSLASELSSSGMEFAKEYIRQYHLVKGVGSS